MRTARNELYGHSAGTAISDTDFLNQWTAVEASIKFIVKCCNDADFENQMTKNIDNAKTGPLDINSIVHVFKLTSRHDEMVQSKLDAIKEPVDDVSTTLKGNILAFSNLNQIICNYITLCVMIQYQ